METAHNFSRQLVAVLHHLHSEKTFSFKHSLSLKSSSASAGTRDLQKQLRLIPQKQHSGTWNSLSSKNKSLSPFLAPQVIILQESITTVTKLLWGPALQKIVSIYPPFLKILHRCLPKTEVIPKEISKLSWFRAQRVICWNSQDTKDQFKTTLSYHTSVLRTLAKENRRRCCLRTTLKQFYICRMPCRKKLYNYTIYTKHNHDFFNREILCKKQISRRATPMDKGMEVEKAGGELLNTYPHLLCFPVERSMQLGSLLYVLLLQRFSSLCHGC